MDIDPNAAVLIYVDGSACFGGQPNPPKNYNALLYGGILLEQHGKPLDEVFLPLGQGSIGQAEWLSVVKGLELAKELSFSRIRLLSDHYQIVHIINRRETIKKSKIPGVNETLPSIQAFIDKHFDSCSVEWVPRKRNKAHNVIVRGKAAIE